LLGERGHAGNRADAARADDAQHLDLAGLQVRACGGRIGPRGVEHAAQHVQVRRGLALVGHVFHRRAGLALEQLTEQVGRGPVAPGAVCDTALALGPGDELSQVARRHVRRHHEHRAAGGDLGQRLEVSHRIVWDLLLQQRHRGVRQRQREHQRVAVGRRLGDEIGRHDAARAWLGIDDHRLVPTLLQRLAVDPRDVVDGSPGGAERHDTDRPVRKTVISRNRAGSEHQERAADASQRGPAVDERHCHLHR
jgi:hypothetical protein